jgi:hypothetical protein
MQIDLTMASLPVGSRPRRATHARRAKYNRFANCHKRGLHPAKRKQACRNLLYYAHPDFGHLAEHVVFSLLLILVVVGICLAVGLFVGGLFVQGYIYTEPSPHLRWGAPVAGAILFGFYVLWCLLVVFAASTPSDIPYDALHRFSPRVDRFTAPPKDLWVVRKGGKEEHYIAKKFPRGQGLGVGYEYRSADTDRPWNGNGVETIIFRPDDTELRLERVPEAQREQGAYRDYVSSDGWTMTEYDTGPTGIPSRFRIGRFLMNMVLNFIHLALWFVCLWLLMRFMWSHALVAAFVLWIASTLIVLPMLLSYAAEVSQARQPPPVRHAQ